MKQDSPSATAKIVAIGMLMIGNDRRFRDLVDESSHETHMRLLPFWGLDGINRVLQSDRYRRFLFFFERMIMPGLALHFAIRKRLIEDLCRRAILERGIDRVVVLGAGFDTLAARLSGEFLNVRFVEVDHPATQSSKRRWLENRNDRVLYCPCDFMTQSLEEELARLEKAKDTKILFIAEGVLMYLSEIKVKELMSALKRLSGGKGEFLFSFMEQRAKESLGFRNFSWITKLWLRLMGEPLLWGSDPDNLPDFLLQNHLLELRQFNSAYMREEYLSRRGLAMLPLAEGESICLAEFSEFQSVDAEIAIDYHGEVFL